MRILMVGGTRFVGKHMVAAALERGHEVTLFHRGRTGGALFPGVEHRTGDRDRDLSALETGSWDATVDTCAYVPRQVHALADVLGDRGGHHLLVSSVSVYAPPDGPGFDEDAALLELEDPTTEEVTAETYGGLKVLCERVAVERHGPETLLVRPSYVIGPDDYTWRFPWWVERIAAGGDVVVPGPPDAPAQAIDVRDLGAWMVQLLERNQAGAFHAASPAPVFTWQQLLECVVAAVAPPGTRLVWVTPDDVAAAGVGGGAFPLWSQGSSEEWALAADPARAYRTGLSPRPVEETVRDTLDWLRGEERPAGVGLGADEERELLRSALAG